MLLEKEKPHREAFYTSKYGAVRILCDELRVEERERSLEDCRARTKVVCRRAVVTTAAVILHACLAMRFLREDRCPQAQVYAGDMILHGTYDRVVSVIEVKGRILPKRDNGENA